MADDRVDEIIIDVKIREESARRVSAVLKMARQELKSVSAAVKELDASGNSSTKGIDKAATSVHKLSDELRDLRKSIEDNRDLSLGDLRGSIEGDGIRGSARDIIGAGSAPDAGGRGSSLRLAGSQLRQLPSIAIPGLGIGTDAVANIVRVGGAIGELSEKAGLSGTQLTAASVGAAGLAAALVLVVARFNAVKQAAMADVDARAAAVRILASNNKEEIQSRINVLSEQRRINGEIARDANDQLAAYRQRIALEKGIVGAAITEIDAAAGIGAGELAAMKDAATKANAELNKTGVELDLLQGVSGLTAKTTAELAAEEEHLKAVREGQKSFISDLLNDLNAENDARKAIASSSSKQLQDRLKEISDEIIANSEYVDKLRERALADKAAGEENQTLIDEINRVAAATDALSATYQALSEDSVAAAIKAREAKDEQKQIRDDSIGATKKYNDDIARIEEQNFNARAAIEARYQDTLIAIAERAAEAAANALEKLKDTRDKLGRSLSDAGQDATAKAQFDALERQISFQEDEAKAARDHAADLLKIRKEANDQEQDLIAARDFSGLFRARRDTTRRINDANSDYARERAERLIAFQQRNEEQARQFAFEAQQRQIKYKRDLDAAEAQYKKELAANDIAFRKANQRAEQARRDDLATQDRKYRDELTMRYNAIRVELNMIAQGNAGKLALEAQYYQQSQNLIRQYLSSANPTGAGVGVGFGAGAFATGRQATSIVVNQTNNVTSGTDANKVAEMIDNRTIAILRQAIPRASRQGY